MDFKTRDKNGLKPLKPVLQKLEAVSSMKDFQSLAHDFVMSGFVLPFGLTVETNARDNSQKQLVLRQAPAYLNHLTNIRRAIKKVRLNYQLIVLQQWLCSNKPEKVTLKLEN
nr:hypothetical protein [Streptococcus agalactiae]